MRWDEARHGWNAGRRKDEPTCVASTVSGRALTKHEHTVPHRVGEYRLILNAASAAGVNIRFHMQKGSLMDPTLHPDEVGAGGAQRTLSAADKA